jgi:hypothetical protein
MLQGACHVIFPVFTAHIIPGVFLILLCFVGCDPYICVAIITLSGLQRRSYNDKLAKLSGFGAKLCRKSVRHHQLLRHHQRLHFADHRRAFHRRTGESKAFVTFIITIDPFLCRAPWLSGNTCLGLEPWFTSSQRSFSSSSEAAKCRNGTKRKTPTMWFKRLDRCQGRGVAEKPVELLFGALNTFQILIYFASRLNGLGLRYGNNSRDNLQVI